MFKRLLPLLLPLTALLAGCQSQALPGAVGAPPASSFSVRTTAPATAPKVLSEAQVRRLMQAYVDGYRPADWPRGTPEP